MNVWKTQRGGVLTLCHVLTWIVQNSENESYDFAIPCAVMGVMVWTVKASGCFLFGDVENEMIDKIWSSFQTFLVHWHALMWLYTPSDRKVPGGREQLIKAATFEQTVPCSCARVIVRSQKLWKGNEKSATTDTRFCCMWITNQDKDLKRFF